MVKVSSVALKDNTALVKVLDTSTSKELLSAFISTLDSDVSSSVGLVAAQVGAKYSAVEIVKSGKQVDFPDKVPQLNISVADTVIVADGAISVIDGPMTTAKYGFIYTDSIIAKLEGITDETGE